MSRSVSGLRCADIAARGAAPLAERAATPRRPLAAHLTGSSFEVRWSPPASRALPLRPSAQLRTASRSAMPAHRRGTAAAHATGETPCLTDSLQRRSIYGSRRDMRSVANAERKVAASLILLRRRSLYGLRRETRSLADMHVVTNGRHEGRRDSPQHRHPRMDAPAAPPCGGRPSRDAEPGETAQGTSAPREPMS